MLWHACAPAASPESRAETQNLPPTRKLGDAPALHCGLGSQDPQAAAHVGLALTDSTLLVYYVGHDCPCGSICGFSVGWQSHGHIARVCESCFLHSHVGTLLQCPLFGDAWVCWPQLHTRLKGQGLRACLALAVCRRSGRLQFCLCMVC